MTSVMINTAYLLIHLLTKGRQLWHSHGLPEKKGNGFDSLESTKAHQRRNAVFLRVFAVVRPLWVAIAGAFGLLVLLLCTSLSTRYLPPAPFDSGERINRTLGGQP